MSYYRKNYYKIIVFFYKLSLRVGKKGRDEKSGGEGVWKREGEEKLWWIEWRSFLFWFVLILFKYGENWWVCDYFNDYEICVFKEINEVM